MVKVRDYRSKLVGKREEGEKASVGGRDEGL